jgi:5-methylcytosine-specific restriction protein A
VSPILHMCPRCGALERAQGYCPACRRQRSRRRGTRQQQGYTDHWLRLRDAAIRAQPWCSQCGTTHDLTGDHILPLSRGGINEPTNIRVLCRRCNSRRGNRTTGHDAPAPAPTVYVV